MRSASITRLAALLLALFGFVSVAHAAPITYVQTGTASGTIGGSAFTDVLVVVTLTGDTADVISDPFAPDFPCAFCFANAGLVTVEIPGIGTATVTDPTGIWAFGQPVDLDDDPTTPDSPGVVIGTVDHPPALDSFTGLGGTLNFALLDYDLTTPIATVGGIVSGVGYPPGLLVNTTLGNLSFTSNLSANSTDGSFTATVGAVPEPATMLLFGSGIAAFADRRRVRTRP
jgi:hypothetical protein